MNHDAYHFCHHALSIVLIAGRGDTPHARDALAKLADVLVSALRYAAARSSAGGCQDLTQEFFARLLDSRCGQCRP
jgi:hypothetical protein